MDILSRTITESAPVADGPADAPHDDSISTTLKRETLPAQVPLLGISDADRGDTLVGKKFRVKEPSPIHSMPASHPSELSDVVGILNAGKIVEAKQVYYDKGLGVTKIKLSYPPGVGGWVSTRGKDGEASLVELDSSGKEIGTDAVATNTPAATGRGGGKKRKYKRRKKTRRRKSKKKSKRISKGKTIFPYAKDVFGRSGPSCLGKTYPKEINCLNIINFL